MRKKISISVLSVLIILFSMQLYPCCNQGVSNNKLATLPVDSFHINRGDIRVMFYNVENLFDTLNDASTADGEFTPDGSKHWTGYRYQQKLNSLYKVIIAAGGYHPPEIIGLCEVENKKVLIDLVEKTPLSKFKYQIVHEESPDHRGIDVAMLYLPKKIKVINHQAIPVHIASADNYTTRDILHVTCRVKKEDTVHIFINHWPSRRGGLQASEPRRITAAETLKKAVWNVNKDNKNAKIIITGDFNDEPNNKSISKTLNAQQCAIPATPEQLYNLSLTISNKKQSGTYKYRQQWNMLDQFIVSGALLNSNNKLKTGCRRVQVFRTDFLLQEDQRYPGYYPKRTYLGPRYKGGFSDHLPVLLDLDWK